MKALKTMVLCVALGFGFSACGGSPMGEYNKLVDKLCKCADMDCMKKVGEEMSALKKKHPDYKPSKEDMKAARDKMKGCTKEIMKKVMGGKKSSKPAKK